MGGFPHPQLLLPSLSLLQASGVCRPQLSLSPQESLACCPAQPKCSFNFRLLEFNGHVFGVSLSLWQMYKGKKPIFSGRGLKGMLEFCERKPWKAQSPVSRTVVELLSISLTLTHIQGDCGGLQTLLASGEKLSGTVNCCVELGKCGLTGLVVI